MNPDEEQPTSSAPPERPVVTSAEAAAARWAEGMRRAGARPPAPKPARVSRAEFTRLEVRLARIERNLDHMHTDIAALREVERIPRPECYPEPPKRKRRAQRAQEEQP